MPSCAMCPSCTAFEKRGNLNREGAKACNSPSRHTTRRGSSPGQRVILMATRWSSRRVCGGRIHRHNYLRERVRQEW